MASAIGPGDWVECVDDSAPWDDEDSLLRRGSLYLVERVDDVGYLPAPSLLLAGVRCPGNPDGVYITRRFRPIYRPKADLIESLKAPPKSAEPRQREEA